MSNPVKGELGFETEDGEAFTLLFSYDALVVIEDRLDKGLTQVMAMLKQGRLGAVRAIFWAGLQDKHPQLTERAAGELILRVEGRAERVQELIAEALLLAFPEAREAAEGAAGPRKRPAAA